MKYAYYNSCSLRASGKDYAKSIEVVFSKLDIEAIEPKDWVCCGSTIAHHTSKMLALALPLKNLALVEEMGFNEFIIPCTACYNRFKIAQYEYENDTELAAELDDIIEYKYKNTVNIIHPIELLNKDEYIEKIRKLATRDMTQLKVASYYGCLIVRPPKMIRFSDDHENPQLMEKLLNAAGIKTTEWSYKTECCGGSLSLTRPNKVIELSGRVLENVRAVGANAIAVPCSFCQLNLDVRQEDMKSKHGKDYDMPIFYFSELLALAIGVAEKDILLNKHFVDTKKVLTGVKV